MDERDWDEVWQDMGEGSRPDPLVEDLVERLLPGRSIDLGCGLGENVMALAAAGWEARGADSSAVAIANASNVASNNGARFSVVDLADGIPGSGYDLITMFYVHLQIDIHATLLADVARSLNPGGTFLYVGHDEDFAAKHHGRMGSLEHEDDHQPDHETHRHDDHRPHGDDEDGWADREVGDPDRIASLLPGLTIMRAEKISRRIFHGPQEIDVTDVVVEARRD